MKLDEYLDAKKYKVGMVNSDGKYIYERRFNKGSLETFHSKHHWKFKVRLLILIQGARQ
jgi:hypothetical protein